MEENKSKNLKVSDCHTGHFSLVQEKKLDEITGKFKNVDVIICDVCRRPCKVVEMITDDIKPEEETKFIKIDTASS